MFDRHDFLHFLYLRILQVLVNQRLQLRLKDLRLKLQLRYVHLVYQNQRYLKQKGQRQQRLNGNGLACARHIRHGDRGAFGREFRDFLAASAAGCA